MSPKKSKTTSAAKQTAVNTPTTGVRSAWSSPAVFSEAEWNSPGPTTPTDAQRRALKKALAQIEQDEPPVESAVDLETINFTFR